MRNVEGRARDSRGVAVNARILARLERWAKRPLSRDEQGAKERVWARLDPALREYIESKHVEAIDD